MSFAASYLLKHALFAPYIAAKPLPDLGIVVALPCCNETNLPAALQSLWDCRRPGCAVEVIIVVNSGENASAGTLQNNLKTMRDAEEWISGHPDPRFCFHVLHHPDLPAKKAGVGLARKIAMDEAVVRFNLCHKPDGIILCFDADASCDANYFCAIEDYFVQNPKTTAASVYFEHPLSGEGFEPLIFKGISQYELHLRYFLNAQRYTGFPFAFHTVGSSMCVKAEVYCRQGGMNQRQAGEDFYLLQKIIPLGHFGEINKTRVIPSPRVSEKVPFGTGATMQKFVQSGGEDILTYHPQSFVHLKQFFALVPGLYKADESLILEVIQKQDAALQQYLTNNGAMEALLECSQHTASCQKFVHRFFCWFNAFRMIRFLNISHQEYYPYIPVATAAAALAEMQKHGAVLADVSELLQFYRKLDRGF